jgi:hypothetical protein
MPEDKSVNSPESWHIINSKDYIDGPFESFDGALAEAMFLGQESRKHPKLKRLTRDFHEYHAPYDRQEKWLPMFWICTQAAAVARGIPESRFTPLRGDAA